MYGIAINKIIPRTTAGIFGHLGVDRLVYRRRTIFRTCTWASTGTFLGPNGTRYASCPKKSRFLGPPLKCPLLWICPHQNYFVPPHINNRYIHSYFGRGGTVVLTLWRCLLSDVLHRRISEGCDKIIIQDCSIVSIVNGNNQRGECGGRCPHKTFEQDSGKS